MEFKATANSNTTLGYATYNSTTWHVGSSEGAMQGSYDTDRKFPDSGRRVGLMVFNGAGDALKHARISEIVLSVKCDNAGFGDRNKTLYLYTSNTQTLNKSLKGSECVGEAIGTYSGTFYNSTDKITMNATTNPELFANMQKYLRGGNSALVIFNEANQTAYQDYSRHYLRITSATLTVTYEEGGTVKYDTGTEWKTCMVYYDNGSEFVPCQVFYDTGTEFKPIGG